MKSKSVLYHVLVRISLVLSLVASALVGAVIATELRPVKPAVAAHRLVAVQPRPVVVVPTATVTPVATPAPPTRAILAVDDGRAIPHGAWIQSRTATLRITLMPLHKTVILRAQAEIQQADTPYTGLPTISGPAVRVEPGTPVQTTITISNLVDGQRYQWRVRAQAANATVSDWSGDGLFGVSAAAPLPPQLATTNIRLNGWADITQPLFRWTDAGSRLPVSYYNYAVVAGTHIPATGLTWKQAQGSVLVLPRLAPGRWQVLVQAVDVAASRSKPARWEFGISRERPPAPTIIAVSPAQGAWSNIALPSVRWTGVARDAPIAGYQYALSFGTTPTPGVAWKSVDSAMLSFPGLADGDWYVQIRSVDALGKHSSPVHWSFHLDRQHPLLTTPTLARSSFSPPIEQIHMQLGLGTAAALAYQVYALGKNTPIYSATLGQRDPGSIHDITWNGYLAPKRIAPAGAYTISVSAIDRAGNSSTVTSAPFTLLDKRIVISISKEELWAYQGTTVVLHTLVTNGGQDTPTIPGIFHVLGKYPNFVFHSPWPKSSPFWYADSPTSFALLYQAQGGYFLHDAPWRSNFGPGSNSLAGSPGGNYTGTHGCTNVPYDQMKQIYNWADVGTVVQILR